MPMFATVHEPMPAASLATVPALDHALLLQPLSECRSDVILAEFFHERVFRQDCQRRKLRDHLSDHRKKHVMDLFYDLLEEA